ncbi:MAG: hypothetical protein IKV63_05950 [Clostridia bacterium]|nr:hypothetical protein [Clostridia bacterium]
MRKFIVLLTVLCLMLAGCSNQKTEATTAAATESTTAATEATQAATEKVEAGNTILPLEDSTMENLTDAILAVSLEEGGAYVDGDGRMQMDVKIYSYDKYDMVDVSNLKVGDVLVRNDGEVEITSLEQNDAGTILVNGGLENGGFDLGTDDCGLFFEIGYDDAKNWYEVGEATIRVSTEFKFIDNMNPDKEIVVYPGDFLNGTVTDYNFTPRNTTIRVEEGQIVEMNRVYNP